LTLIIGVLCQDGVVVASDSAATFGTDTAFTIGQQPVQKVTLVNDHILYASTGAVGLSQIVADRLRQLWEGKALSGLPTPEAAMDRLGKEIGAFVEPYLRTAQMQRQLVGSASSSLCKSLVALPVSHKPCLFQFDYNGAPERATPQLPFVALGSGQPIADPFLAFLRRLFWSNHEPTLAEGRFAAVWTIDHVRRTNPGGVGGNIQLATLEPVPGKPAAAKVATPDEVQEHLQKVEQAEAALQAHVRGAATEAAPPPTTAGEAE